MITNFISNKIFVGFIFFLLGYLIGFLLTIDKSKSLPLLSKTISSLKKQIYEVQKNAATASENAMFSIDQVTINLKTVINKENSFKVVSGDEKVVGLENVWGFSKEQTQDLTLVLNPLKVFSEKVGTLKVTYKVSSK